MTYPFATMLCTSRALYSEGTDPNDVPPHALELIYNMARAMLKEEHYRENFEENLEFFDDNEIMCRSADDLKPEHVFTPLVLQTLGLDAYSYEVAELGTADGETLLVAITTTGGNPMGNIMDPKTKLPVFYVDDAIVETFKGGAWLDDLERCALRALMFETTVFEVFGAWLASLEGAEADAHAELIARYAAP